jgi:hypothetical protein
LLARSEGGDESITISYASLRDRSMTLMADSGNMRR